MKSEKLRNWAMLCVLLVVAVLSYADPFQILKRPKSEFGGLPLDMAPYSIDDMFDGCRSAAASMIDMFGVFEWHYNRKFSFAWALSEREAKKPLNMHLTEDHAIVLHMFSKANRIRQDFNQAVKRGKHKYSTGGFKFHYFYYYLTDAIQILRHNETSCRTTYHRTWKHFKRDVINTNMRFGAFTWAASNKHSLVFNGNVSCFEIYTCFGADITYYSYIKQKEQVLIPPYEVFKVTDVVTSEPWCSVVYKLQSTKTPKGDVNCRLNQRLMAAYFGIGSTQWQYSVGLMSACGTLLIISSLVLIKRKQKCFVAVVLAPLLVLAVTAVMLT
ncbi:T-cell ecto-ADP-ribosyltransferase 1-like [Mugil cephalus]|uniref:T-cell ecto-ADP-ribosyltransferase 1-like n=1 Tax=Mugil cephalus TaxID=48193 RepID=UPI001FB7D22C|nr:T-cell ecto-ADP-ribosyltransferase 1-like [Mugil cephalus]